MVPCNQCHSSGLATCPDCGGLGHVREDRDSGEMEYHVCTECDGKKSARCDACGGIGWLGADNAVALPADYRAVVDLLEACRDGGRPELAAIERLVSGDW